jgi:hypothetical protein
MVALLPRKWLTLILRATRPVVGPSALRHAPPALGPTAITRLRSRQGAEGRVAGEAEKARLEITPVSGDKIESLVLEVYRNTTPELAAKAGAAMK